MAFMNAIGSLGSMISMASYSVIFRPGGFKEVFAFSMMTKMFNPTHSFIAFLKVSRGVIVPPWTLNAWISSVIAFQILIHFSAFYMLSLGTAYFQLSSKSVRITMSDFTGLFPFFDLQKRLRERQSSLRTSHYW